MTQISKTSRGSSPPTRDPRRLAALAILFLLALPVAFPSTGAEEAPSDPASTTEAVTSTAVTWTDAEIAAAMNAACEPGHDIRYYRGTRQKFDIVGPLWLAERGDERARGVVLPTFLRLYHYAHHRHCSRMEMDEARELAGSETWVVLWRVETPFRGRQFTTDYDQTMLRPTEVRARHANEWHHPVEVRGRDPWINRWFFDDWDPEESMVAVFEELPSSSSLWVDYDLDEPGQTYQTDSSLFSMSSWDKKWWALAHGEPEPKGGPWWKR